VLSAREVVAEGGVAVYDVACSHARGRGAAHEQAGGHAVVFVRRGCFSRAVDGTEALLDPTVAYCMNPGEEQRYDHPHSHGDDCTSVSLPPELVVSLCGDAPLPSGPLPVSPAADLEHRLLLAATHGGDRHEVVERAVALAARAVSGAPPHPVRARRPATARAQRILVDGARELLAARPETSLAELAATLAVSPHHLSRVFRSLTGHTIARHRMRLRARAALERLAGGEDDLGRLAADVGFSDQSHLCRVIRAETGQTPAVLRAALGPAAD
jgi:AraC-like DNA-binding protein